MKHGMPKVGTVSSFPPSRSTAVDLNVCSVALRSNVKGEHFGATAASMAQAVLLAKRPRPNYSISNLEQQRPGASTPGWLAKTQARSGADTPAGGSNGSPESNASSKENKVPGRGRAAGKKPVARPDAAAQEGEPAGRKQGKQPARRARSVDGRQKQAEPAAPQKTAKKGRKSAPAKAEAAQTNDAGTLAAEPPAPQEGSKGGAKSKSKNAQVPAGKAADLATSGGKDAAVETPQPAASNSSDRSGRPATKRASVQQPQPAGPKRQRVGSAADADLVIEQPAGGRLGVQCSSHFCWSLINCKVISTPRSCSLRRGIDIEVGQVVALQLFMPVHRRSSRGADSGRS